MSLTSALSNAISGLAANSRAAGVVAANLANIQTDGYGRREITMTQAASGTAGGVRVAAITRHVDAAVLSDRRLADAELAHGETRAAFLRGVQESFGTPDQPGSLLARLAALEASLVTAASRPDALDRLRQVGLEAGALSDAFNRASQEIQEGRTRAEAQIDAAVTGLNADLAQVHELNLRIQAAQRKGADAASLLDHRQVVTDRIAAMIPVREVPREDGAVALMTPGGALLVDTGAATFSFSRANLIAPHMSLENGALSGLRLGGEEIAPSGARSPIAGGRLAALFETRDVLAVDAQRQLDALARDVIERTQDPGWDTTIGAGDAGLFTDAGGRLDPANEVGLAGRLRLNAAVDPARGGDVSRLRDGLGALGPGPAGNADRLHALADALAGPRVMASGDLGRGAASASDHGAAFVTRLAQGVLIEERATSFAAMRQSSLEERLLADGVNSDDETARLLLIEQAYAANARMIQTLDDMMETLLRIRP
ncbi:flagellar hook-associated protein FlgK [Roseovarius aquimarinus]|uniref:Flagellar hook-associated protein 1 n=1 Tax=Roseovarius aquimarinus TaxID=1229156 RepID=A0ABW7IAX4_9RHOB